MLNQKNTLKRSTALLLIVGFISCFAAISNTFAENFPYQAVRLNNGNPIIEPSMFSRSGDGENK